MNMFCAPPFTHWKTLFTDTIIRNESPFYVPASLKIQLKSSIHAGAPGAAAWDRRTKRLTTVSLLSAKTLVWRRECLDLCRSKYVCGVGKEKGKVDSVPDSSPNRNCSRRIVIIRLASWQREWLLIMLCCVQQRSFEGKGHTRVNNMNKRLIWSTKMRNCLL